MRQIQGLEPYTKAGIATAIILMIVSGVCVVSFTVNQWRNATQITQAEVKYRERLTEEIGRPQEIIQTYRREEVKK